MKLKELPPILDFEASSLDFAHSYPIAAGLLVAGEKHEWLIKPKAEWTDWSEASELIHGISRDKLQREGLAAEQVLDALVETLAGAESVYSDNRDWEQRWGQRLGLNSVEYQSVFDLLPHDLAPFYPRLQAMIFKQHNLKQHSASDDALAIGLTIIDMHAMANE